MLAVGRAGTEGGGKKLEVPAAEIGYGPITDAILVPGEHIIAGDRSASVRGDGARGRDGRQADQVLAVPVDERRQRHAPDHVDAAADQGKTFVGEVDDARRL